MIMLTLPKLLKCYDRNPHMKQNINTVLIYLLFLTRCTETEWNLLSYWLREFLSFETVMCYDYYRGFSECVYLNNWKCGYKWHSQRVLFTWNRLDKSFRRWMHLDTQPAILINVQWERISFIINGILLPLQYHTGFYEWVWVPNGLILLYSVTHCYIQLVVLD